MYLPLSLLFPSARFDFRKVSEGITVISYYDEADFGLNFKRKMTKKKINSKFSVNSRSITPFGLSNTT
jgi:hypothetical protein